MTSLPSSFLKYVKSERTDILENGMIRFTQSKYLNDPFELKPTITHLTHHCFSDARPIEVSAATAPTKEDREFSQRRFNKINYFEEIFQENADTQGILSLTGSEKMSPMPSIQYLDPLDPRINPLMWSHYTESHEGFIIEFSKGFIPNLDIKKVTYTNERRIMTFEDVHRGDNSNYYEKSTAWKYENEYRAILPISSASKYIPESDAYLFKFEKSKVRSIAFGCRIREDVKRKILNILKNDPQYKGVHTYVVRISESNHMLEYFHEYHSDDGGVWSNLSGPLSSQRIRIQSIPEITNDLIVK